MVLSLSILLLFFVSFSLVSTEVQIGLEDTFDLQYDVTTKTPTTPVAESFFFIKSAKIAKPFKDEKKLLVGRIPDIKQMASGLTETASTIKSVLITREKDILELCKKCPGIIQKHKDTDPGIIEDAPEILLPKIRRRFNGKDGKTDLRLTLFGDPLSALVVDRDESQNDKDVTQTAGNSVNLNVFGQRTGFVNVQQETVTKPRSYDFSFFSEKKSSEINFPLELLNARRSNAEKKCDTRFSYFDDPLSNLEVDSKAREKVKPAIPAVLGVYAEMLAGIPQEN